MGGIASLIPRADTEWRRRATCRHVTRRSGTMTPHKLARGLSLIVSSAAGLLRRSAVPGL